MIKHLAIKASLTLLLLWAAMPASHAATEWASWSLADPSDAENPRDAVGSFADGRSMIASGNLSSFKVPGDLYIADPAIPGAPGNGNPSYILAPTGAPGGSIATDDPIMIFDLTSFPVDTDTIFGIADMVEPASYRLEILDAQSNPLSLDDLVLTYYNLSYPNDLVADFNILLNRSNGLLSVDPTHDSGNSDYIHSGLTTFGNLPSQAEMIRILSGKDQLSEGVQWYFGAAESIPLPGAAWLFGSALGFLGWRRYRRD